MTSGGLEAWRGPLPSPGQINATAAYDLLNPDQAVARWHRRVAALLYTLLESAKLAGVDPHAYVLAAARRAIATPGAVTGPANLT